MLGIKSYDEDASIQQVVIMGYDGESNKERTEDHTAESIIKDFLPNLKDVIINNKLATIKSFDEDKDGFLTMKDFFSYADKVEYGNKKFLFVILDKDLDGKVSIDEVASMDPEDCREESFEECLMNMIKSWDSDKDGYLTIDDLKLNLKKLIIDIDDKLVERMMILGENNKFRVEEMFQMLQIDPKTIKYDIKSKLSTVKRFRMNSSNYVVLSIDFQNSMVSIQFFDGFYNNDVLKFQKKLDEFYDTGDSYHFGTSFKCYCFWTFRTMWDFKLHYERDEWNWIWFDSHNSDNVLSFKIQPNKKDEKEVDIGIKSHFNEAE